jgi:hypothetical protein
MSPRRHLELYQEYPEPDEAEVAREVVDYLKRTTDRRNFLSGTTQRFVHAKSVAALKAEFTVDLDLPAEFRHGVFQPGRSYPAWIRLSNSAQHPAPDKKLDARGFAIKLMNVDGRSLLSQEGSVSTQDFVLLSRPTFFNRDTKEFYEFVQAFNGSKLRLVWFFLTHPAVFFTGLGAAKRYGNLLGIQFWSTTPYRLGELAVKYSAKPRVWDRMPVPASPDQNYLRVAAAATLAETEVLYDFFVQVQVDPYRQPIEDALVEWSEKLSPLQKVATIRIPKQRVDIPERNWVAENLAMDVWHALPAHRPLGNVNRSRGLIYLHLAEFRRARNLVPLAEPSATPDFFAD